MNLFDAITLFLDSHTNAATRKTYRLALRPLSQFIGPDRPLADIEPVDVIKFQNRLKAKNYAPATLRQRVKTVKTFFNWLEKTGLSATNPGKAIQNKRLKPPKTRDKAMTDAELDLILGYVRFRSQRDYALILFLADTGCRVAGAAGLKTNHLDLDKREAEVTEKGDLTRQVRYGQVCAVAIRKWILMRKPFAGPYVFSDSGTSIKPDSLSQRIRRACHGLQKLGYSIRTLSAHSLRHRKGFQFADQRIAPTYAATALGHQSVLTTIEHYYPQDWESAAEILDELSIQPGHIRSGSQDK